MPTLQNIYDFRGRGPAVVAPQTFIRESSFPVNDLPFLTLEERAQIDKAERSLLDSLNGVIFDPADIRVGLCSIIDGRACAHLKVQNPGVTLMVYQSSGANLLRTGKHSGDWYAFMGIAESGWFVKSSRLGVACRGDHLYLSSLQQFLGLTHLEKRIREGMKLAA